MKAVVAAFNQEKALVGAFSVITNLRMELFQALALTLDVHFTGAATIGVGLAVLPAHRRIIRRAQKNWEKLLLILYLQTYMWHSVTLE